MYQQSLYTNNGDNLTSSIASRATDLEAVLGHKYYLTDFPTYYFIVRKDVYSNAADDERVCLYREGAINVILKGNRTPYTEWIGNDPRCNRDLMALYRDIRHKIQEHKPKDILKPMRYGND